GRRPEAWYATRAWAVSPQSEAEGAQPTRPHPGGQFAARLKRRKIRMHGRKKHLQSGVATGKKRPQSCLILLTVVVEHRSSRRSRGAGLTSLLNGAPCPVFCALKSINPTEGAS